MVLNVGRERGVATLTLNRPEKLNALNWELLDALQQTLDTTAGDPTVRCVVLVGAGERAFSAGADLRELRDLTLETAREWARRGHRLFNRLAMLPQPVVAAIRGYALGGGMEMVLACDLRIAAEDARLGLPEVSRGWLPAWGGLRRLPAIVGAARAREVALLGEPVDAATALAWGLVQRVVPSGRLAEETAALAERLSGLSPGAVRRAKAALAVPGLVVDERTIDEDADLMAGFVAAPGYREQIEAFLSRRRS